MLFPKKKKIYIHKNFKISSSSLPTLCYMWGWNPEKFHTFGWGLTNLLPCQILVMKAFSTFFSLLNQNMTPELCIKYSPWIMKLTWCRNCHYFGWCALSAIVHSILFHRFTTIVLKQALFYRHITFIWKIKKSRLFSLHCHTIIIQFCRSTLHPKTLTFIPFPIDFCVIHSYSFGKYILHGKKFPLHAKSFRIQI